MRTQASTSVHPFVSISSFRFDFFLFYVQIRRCNVHKNGLMNLSHSLIAALVSLSFQIIKHHDAQTDAQSGETQ